jgi:hypothetical protein
VASNSTPIYLRLSFLLIRIFPLTPDAKIGILL